MKRTLPPTYLLTSLILLAGLWALLPGPRIIEAPWNLLGVELGVLGVGLNLVGNRQFQKAKTAMNPFGQPRVLVTTGVFRYSRNPMYLGMVLLVLGIAMLVGRATPFVAPALLWIALKYRFIAHEERAMAERFGEDYTLYQTCVRRWV